MFAKYVVLGARHVRRAHAGPHGGDARLQRLDEHAEGAPLRLARLAHHQRAANLGEIAFDGGRQLRGDEIACGDPAFATAASCRKTSLPPEPMIMKLSGQPRRRRCASISATTSYLAAARPHRAAELLIGLVRQLRGAPHRCDFARALLHEKLVEERRRVAQRKTAHRIGEPARQKAPRRRGEALIGDGIKPRADCARNIGGKMHPRHRRFKLRAFGLGGAVEINSTAPSDAMSAMPWPSRMPKSAP